MDLEIRLFAGLRERAGTSRLALRDVEPGCSVAEVKRRLAAAHPELGPLDHARGVFGTRYAPDSAPVAGDEPFSLLPPVSGG